MKRYILLISIALMAASCGKKATVKIEVKSAAGKEVLFSKLNFNKIDVVDKVAADEQKGTANEHRGTFALAVKEIAKERSDDCRSDREPAENV